MLKVILVALCANLLYTNANLMIEATATLRPWAAVLMVAFALTYSLISTLAIFRVKSAAAVAAFALLDGFAVYTHLAPHGEVFQATVAAYFGIYTTYTLCVCFFIRKDEAVGTNGDQVEGHDAAYWHKCFLYQKSRADNAANGDKMTPIENTEHLREVTKMIEDEPKELPDVREEINAEHQDADISKTILSIKRAFNRMKDPDKRRERIKDMPLEVQAEIRKIYDL